MKKALGNSSEDEYKPGAAKLAEVRKLASAILAVGAMA